MGTTHIDENGVIRYRRAKSVSRAEDIQKEEAKVRRSQPDKPVYQKVSLELTPNNVLDER
ncbi:unnamed protein product [Timema podura]|uniref:Uncharacterized protein n=1 Tax=Timema podura TaxID=61482 RepID=A0ABN7P6A7_TIMPD|nr:unnamed protein product [Timema podura]